jgi:hypothetical protein
VTKFIASYPIKIEIGDGKEPSISYVDNIIGVESIKMISGISE